VIAPYRTKTEIGGADWRCEYWGKWFTSLTLADAYHSTPATREMCDEAALTNTSSISPQRFFHLRLVN